MILHSLVALRGVVLHLLDKIGIESRMAAQRIDDALSRGWIELPPSDLGDRLVAEIVPSSTMRRESEAQDDAQINRFSRHFTEIQPKSSKCSIYHRVVR